jgi:hypothetical protein
MSRTIEAILMLEKESHTKEFSVEEKELSSAIQIALSKAYLSDLNEIDLVKETIYTMNSRSKGRFRLESVFIHGKKSQIQFDWYGKIAKKEMGDLIFVSTLTYKSKPYFQKMTIVQAKKDDEKKRCSWGIDPEQLFFLTYWPPFEGVTGIFPKNRITISDNSGCLGSYVLYREPGDFSFIAARRLGRSIGLKRRISLDEVHDLLRTPEINDNKESHQYMPFPFQFIDPHDMYDSGAETRF